MTGARPAGPTASRAMTAGRVAVAVAVASAGALAGAFAATTAGAAPEGRPAVEVERSRPVDCRLTIGTDAQLAEQGAFSTLRPGTTVCLRPGVYRRALVVADVAGTAARPLVFTAAPGSGTVELQSGLLLRRVGHVQVRDLQVRHDPALGGAAVTLDVGTHHARVGRLTVEGAFVGIAIGSSEGPAGVGNEVHDNVVRGSWNTGIAINVRSDGSATEPNRVRGNTVVDSGGHGIESSDANGAVIDGNTVVRAGTGIRSVQQGGYSGIHLYASAPSTAASPHGVRCTGNRITANKVSETQERPGRSVCRDGSGSGRCADGNGIQVDLHCSANLVADNEVTANAGNGISVYGATGNEILRNVAFGNNQQADRTAFLPSPAEIGVSAVNLPPGSARGNLVRDNTATTTVHRIPAFFLSPTAGDNAIGPNRWFWSPLSRPDASWSPVVLGDRGYASGPELDRATRTDGNRVGAP